MTKDLTQKLISKKVAKRKYALRKVAEVAGIVFVSAGCGFIVSFAVGNLSSAKALGWTSAGGAAVSLLAGWGGHEPRSLKNDPFANDPFEKK